MGTENSTRRGKRKKLRVFSSPGPRVTIKFKWRNLALPSSDFLLQPPTPHPSLVLVPVLLLLNLGSTLALLCVCIQDKEVGDKGKHLEYKRDLVSKCF